MWPNRYFGRYWGDRYWMNNGGVSSLGTTMFVATKSARGDAYSKSATGDRYSKGARGDSYSKSGGKA